ncbi:MAG: hypothetical protein HFE78_00515 [Clostridiales bacterium]|nr:hypothetical protein [Clostridiales bacterium]
MEQTDNAIIDRFALECARFAKESEALGYVFLPVASRKTKGVQGAAAVFSFTGFQASLIYNTYLGKARSVLECRIAIGSETGMTAAGTARDTVDPAEKIDFSLYDLLYLLNENDFNCYIFPYIESPQRLSACVQVLFDALAGYKERISGLACDPALTNRAKNQKRRELQRFFKMDIFEDTAQGSALLLDWQLAAYREWYVARFCSKWYADFAAGRYDAAVKRFAKYDNKSFYEQRLFRFMKTLSAGASYQAASQACNTYLHAGAVSGLPRIAAQLLGMLVLLPVCLAGSFLFFLLAYLAIYRNALYASSLWSPLMFLTILLCALLLALCGSNFIYPRFMSRKKRKQWTQLRFLMDSKEERRRLTRLTHSMIIVSLVMLLLAAKTGVALYPKGFVDNTALFTQINEPFTQLKTIYKATDTGLYHLAFQDGRVYSCSEETAFAYVFPYVDIEATPIDSFR